ncbi:hypothetical protein G4177_10100 [Corallococcus sp. ZKHCc1 1396]|uniref:Outer membrane protein beta-barrel domain-containing protein n=1 Tax=Corallococcus soli TaxID=2710757 RepID=A0ABR9PKU3_9BACT|nr:hypothetical protein [Corallococcus soli]MBE4748515.1 hypothetical protein [Corallococcus soli]
MTARPFLSSLMVSSFLLWAAPVEAQPLEPKGAGFALGFRVAYGIPLGNAVGDVKMTDVIGETVSPQVELAYFFNSRLSLGIYFQFGFGRSPEACFEALCGSNVRRYGIDLDYHFRPGAFVSPWVGVGLGLENATVEFEDEAGETGSLPYGGFDLGHAHVGVDLRINRTMAVGPYVSASLGQYRRSGSRDFSSDGRRVHAWLQPGVRMQLHF